MTRPDYPGEWVDELGALKDQIRDIHSGSNDNELASVWISILLTWFPLAEEHQIRLNYQRDWVDVYVLHNGQAPEESERTINPVFMVRCFNPGVSSPFNAADLNANKFKAPEAIANFCTSIGAFMPPPHVAFMHRDRVQFFHIRWETDRQLDLNSFGGTSYHVSLAGNIPRHLDHIKAYFAVAWGYPYSKYLSESDDELEEYPHVVVPDEIDVYPDNEFVQYADDEFDEYLDEGFDEHADEEPENGPGADAMAVDNELN